MKNYKLSICIPTYNRKEMLEVLLKSILIQIDDSIEIAISDNCSTDGTTEMIQNYMSLHTNIVYHYNNENYGADKNYLKSIEIASGTYCWLMGSDDTLQSDAIKNILNAIDMYKSEIIICNRIECSYNMKEIRQRTWLKETYKENTQFQYKDLGQYFKDSLSIGAVFSYLSSIIVKREEWNEIEDKDLFVGTAYSHVYILLRILLNEKNSLLYMPHYLVNCRGDNDSFTQEGMAKRIMLDIKGYVKLADSVFNDSYLKGLFLNILRKERPLMSLISLRRRTTNREWNEYQSWLVNANYNKVMLVLLKNKKILDILYFFKKTPKL